MGGEQQEEGNLLFSLLTDAGTQVKTLMHPERHPKANTHMLR